jgi:hypothetical protein
MRKPSLKQDELRKQGKGINYWKGEKASNKEIQKNILK